jgi:anaphase-promoting complex subunit 8
MQKLQGTVLEHLQSVYGTQHSIILKKFAVLICAATKASEKKALRDWHKLDSEHAFPLPLTRLISVVDDRRQPAIPVNGSLWELLEMVKNVTDPWLLFLYSPFH